MPRIELPAQGLWDALGSFLHLLFLGYLGPYIVLHVVFMVPGIILLGLAVVFGMRRKVPFTNVVLTSIGQIVLSGIAIWILWSIPATRSLVSSSAIVFVIAAETFGWSLFSRI